MDKNPLYCPSYVKIRWIRELKNALWGDNWMGSHEKNFFVQYVLFFNKDQENILFKYFCTQQSREKVI